MPVGTIQLEAPLNARRQHPADSLFARTKTIAVFTVLERDMVTAVELDGLSAVFRGRTDTRDDGEYLFELSPAEGGIDTDDGTITVEIPEDAIPESGLIWAELVLLDGEEVVSTISYLLIARAGATV